MKKYTFPRLFLLLGFSGICFAAEVPYAEVTSISPWDPHVDVTTNTPHLDPDSCGAGNYYRIDLSSPGANAKLSTLLAAYTTGRKVGLVISGCIGNAPEILGVRF